MISSRGMNRQRRDGRTEQTLRHLSTEGWKEKNLAKAGRESKVGEIRAVGYHESQVKKVCQEEEVINFVKLK
jgi:hypothetical protein